MWLISVTRPTCAEGAGVFKFVVQLSHSLILITESSNMAPHGKELSEDLKRRIVALHEDGQGYKKIANTLKLTCSTVAKIIQHLKRAGSTQNRPVTPGGRQYTRKPANSLLKTCQQSTWITGTISYGQMRWRLICLVLMASSMCGGNQVRSTKIRYNQTWWWECHSLGLHECCRCWRVTFHWGKHELQHVLWNTAAEHDPLPPETGLQGSVPAWQWPQTHLQDDHSFTEEAEGKGDGLAKHVSRLEPNRTTLGDPQVEGGGVQSLKYLPAPRRHHGGVEEHSSGYLWSSGKLLPRRVKAVLDNDGGHTKYWQLTWCMLILTTFPKGCTHFCWQGFSF